jgi:hypothetical protein
MLSLNRPELELNSHNYLAFSPTATKRNFLVTSSISSSKNNSSNNFSSVLQSQMSKKPNYITLNMGSSGLSREDRNTKSLFIGQQKIDTLPESRINTIGRNYNSIGTTQGNIMTNNESVEEFGRELENAPPKESFIAKYSPKKARKTAK